MKQLFILIPIITVFFGSIFINGNEQNREVFAQEQRIDAITRNMSDTFSAIGQISSLVITVPETDFNISDAFKVVLTGEWTLSVDEGNVTNFAASFLASPMDGAKGHIHQFINFKTDNSTKKETFQLTSDNSYSISGTAEIKINGQTIWHNADITISIHNGSTIAIDPDDKDTDNHFGEQQVYGIVTRLVVS